MQISPPDNVSLLSYTFIHYFALVAHFLLQKNHESHNGHSDLTKQLKYQDCIYRGCDVCAYEC